MGRKRANLEENGKLAESLPLRKGRAGYGPVDSRNHPDIFVIQKTEREWVKPGQYKAQPHLIMKLMWWLLLNKCNCQD